MNFLSIQSHVAYGHVGNSAAVFPLQRLGHTVWPVHTTMYSNHAGYPDVAGSVVPSQELIQVIEALVRRGAISRCDAVLSGYLGEAASGDVVLDAVSRVRGYHEDAVYCCDPVMGDGDASYVSGDIVEFMCNRAAREADILTPNLFELSLLTRMSPGSLNTAPLEEIVSAARQLIGPENRTKVVLITSCDHAALPADNTAMAAVTADGAWLVTTPRIHFETAPHGAGDCCAALFCAAILSGQSVDAALSYIASVTYAVLKQTSRAKDSELALVESQGFFAAPPNSFPSESIT